MFSFNQSIFIAERWARQIVTNRAPLPESCFAVREDNSSSCFFTSPPLKDAGQTYMEDFFQPFSRGKVRREPAKHASTQTRSHCGKPRRARMAKHQWGLTRSKALDTDIWIGGLEHSSAPGAPSRTTLFLSARCARSHGQPSRSPNFMGRRTPWEDSKGHLIRMLRWSSKERIMTPCLHK